MALTTGWSFVQWVSEGPIFPLDLKIEENVENLGDYQLLYGGSVKDPIAAVEVEKVDLAMVQLQLVHCLIGFFLFNQQG